VKEKKKKKKGEGGGGGGGGEAGHEECLTVERAEYTQAALISINCRYTSCCKAHYITDHEHRKLKKICQFVYYINLVH